MATTPTLSRNITLFSLLLLLFVTPRINAHQANAAPSGLKLVSAEKWAMSMANYIGLEEDDEFDNEESEMRRRSLFWRGMHYYISYGALSANRVPCPPRSGRSYYTHNCFKARTPVNPYYRGCSRITRCRR